LFSPYLLHKEPFLYFFHIKNLSPASYEFQQFWYPLVKIDHRSIKGASFCVFSKVGCDGTETRVVVSIECWGWIGCRTWIEYRTGCSKMGERELWIRWDFWGANCAGAEQQSHWWEEQQNHIQGLSLLLKVIYRLVHYQRFNFFKKTILVYLHSLLK